MPSASSYPLKCVTSSTNFCLVSLPRRLNTWTALAYTQDNIFWSSIEPASWCALTLTSVQLFPFKCHYKCWVFMRLLKAGYHLTRVTIISRWELVLLGLSPYSALHGSVLRPILFTIYTSPNNWCKLYSYTTPTLSEGRRRKRQSEKHWRRSVPLHGGAATWKHQRPLYVIWENRLCIFSTSFRCQVLHYSKFSNDPKYCVKAISVKMKVADEGATAQYLFLMNTLKHWIL